MAIFCCKPILNLDQKWWSEITRTALSFGKFWEIKGSAGEVLTLQSHIWQGRHLGGWHMAWMCVVCFPLKKRYLSVDTPTSLTRVCINGINASNFPVFDYPNPIFAMIWVKVNPKLHPRKGFCPRMTKFGNCKYCEGKGDSDNGKGKGKSWGGGGIQAPSGQMLEKCQGNLEDQCLPWGNRGKAW